jgi:glycosyltransferase involved in cell wall biosynthesis
VKIAVITCYKQPDYVRAQTLRAAVMAAGHECIVVKNSRSGLLRYPETAWKLLATRLSQRPDAYVLTFRGYEFLPLANILTWPKPLVFDEFINPLQWLEEPRPEAWAPLVPKGFLKFLYRFLLRRPHTVLTDTPQSAAASARLTYGGPNRKLTALPVSTDETVFTPAPKKPHKGFKIFYYGNMLPLHGLSHVLEAAVALRTLPVTFTVVGGKKEASAAVEAAAARGARVSYRAWVDYDKLPAEIHGSDLCLGGPFGDTSQARLVITGKTYQFLACGAPTVVGKTSAANVFIDKRDCLLVPLGDSGALADAIRWAYRHPKKLAAIGRHGRELYDARFSIRAIAPQLQAVLGVQAEHDKK